MSTSTVSRSSASRKSTPTLHTKAVAKERQSRPNRGRAELPEWTGPVGNFLRGLGLDWLQLKEVTNWLDTHRGAPEGLAVPVLNGLHSRQLRDLIHGHTPTASTPDTPHPDDAVIASDDEWAAFRMFFDRSPIESPRRNGASSVGSYNHPVRNRTVAENGWSDHGTLMGRDPFA